MATGTLTFGSEKARRPLRIFPEWAGSIAERFLERGLRGNDLIFSHNNHKKALKVKG
jgi:hypothetical protein